MIKYRIVNHLTGEVFECYAYSKNRARRIALLTAFNWLKSDGIRSSDVRKIFKGRELHLYKMDDVPEEIYLYRED